MHWSICLLKIPIQRICWFVNTAISYHIHYKNIEKPPSYCFWYSRVRPISELKCCHRYCFRFFAISSRYQYVVYNLFISSFSFASFLLQPGELDNIFKSKVKLKCSQYCQRQGSGCVCICNYVKKLLLARHCTEYSVPCSTMYLMFSYFFFFSHNRSSSVTPWDPWGYIIIQVSEINLS